MDTIYNFGSEFMVLWMGEPVLQGHYIGSISRVSQYGIGREAMDCLHNKGSKAMASEFCEMETHDDIVGRQYRLLRWKVI